MTHGKNALQFGSEAHYLDGRYYDQSYRRRREDVDFYANVAQESGGPVLELGAGTGRVAIEIARRGIDVVGVDRIAPMVDRARERVLEQPRRVRDRIELHVGDIRQLKLGRRFPLVIAPFNVFMHLYERKDWERALSTAHRHLRPRGRLVFDVLNPDPKELARDPARTYRCKPVRMPDDGRRYRYGESFHYDASSQVMMITMVFEDEEDPANFFITPLAQRQVFPAELETLLHYNGFAIVDRHGDFDGGSLDEYSESQVVIARPLRKR